MKRACCLAGVLSLLATGLSGQENRSADHSPVTYGNYRRIHSRTLNEDRTLVIRLPADYAESAKEYPVLFVLDGSKNVCLRPYAAIDYLLMSDQAPDHIVVGIENANRGRDMRPDFGADAFLQFLRTELIPFVGSNYRTSGYHILCGQSLSAVFALYSFLKQPDLFDAYLIVSCGLFADSVANRLEDALKEYPQRPKAGSQHLFVADGRRPDSFNPEGTVEQRTVGFLEVLERKVPPSVLMRSKYYEEEGHVPYPAIYDGLKWIYSSKDTAK